MEERRPFPVDSEGRRDAVFNIINNEYKSSIILHLDNKAISGKGVFGRIIETVGGDEFLPKYESTFRSYCSKTLFSIGVVAKENFSDRRGVGYVLTEEGYKYGAPPAVCALDWCYDNNRSLSEIFGQTASSGEVRAPIQRMKILKFLDCGRSFSYSDIACFLGDPEKCGSLYRNHIVPLCEVGFISGLLDRSESDTTNPYYLIKSPTDFDGIFYPRLSKKVVGYLNGVDGANTAQISKRIGENEGHVSSVLGRLFASGYVGNKLNERLSSGDLLRLNLSLSGEGRRFLDTLGYPIWNAASGGSELEKMMERYEAVVNDHDIFRFRVLNGCKRYHAVSSKINQKENLVEIVHKYILDHPGTCSKDIARAVGVKKVDGPIGILRKRENVTLVKNGKFSNYSAVKN